MAAVKLVIAGIMSETFCVVTINVTLNTAGDVNMSGGFRGII